MNTTPLMRMQMIEAMVMLSNAMRRFAEACRQASQNVRDLHDKYGDYMKQRVIHRPVQRLDKKRRHHGRT